MENKKDGKKGFWGRLYNLLSFSRRKIKKLMVVIVILEGAKVISPYILKLIIDGIVNFENEDLKNLLLLVVLMFVVEQSNSFLHYLKDKLIFHVLIDVEYYLPVKSQRKLVNLSLSYHERENTGNKLVKIDRGVNKIVDLLCNVFWEVIPTLSQLIVTLVVLFWINWRIGISFLVFAPLFIFVTFYVNKILYPLRRERHKNYEVASGKMGQSVMNINTVKSFVQERREIKEFGKIRESIKRNEILEFAKMLGFGLGRNLIIDLGRISAILLSIYLVLTGNISVGTVVFVITLTEKSYFSLYRLSRFYDRVEDSAESVNRFIALNEEKQDIFNKKNGEKPKSISGNIEFRDVDFKYNESGDRALKDVNFHIQAGSMTALVGPSGGGKTTVAKMIYRHYDPLQGEVFLDGVDLRDYDLYSFRKFISIVPQEVEIFDGSVRRNISYANPRASMKEIKRAAKIANAEEFIAKLKDGYDTEVGERGVKLSGGQRQRLGIARAILANPDVLIFDEATSSLDSYSERLIQEAMDEVSKNRTVIIIAHRLSTIKKADNILVLEDGKLVESGSHDELSRKKKGLYGKLLKLQELGVIEN